MNILLSKIHPNLKLIFLNSNNQKKIRIFATSLLYVLQGKLK